LEYLPGDNSIIWASSRDSWLHLYRFDADSGVLKYQITRGPWNVTRIVHVDEARGEIMFLAVGRDPTLNPYYEQLYKARLDGSGLTLLTPERATHDVLMAPAGDMFLDTYSTPVTPPVSVLRNSDGAIVQTMGRADISRLLGKGWRPPEPIEVKARDGRTDLYGLLYRPARFDPRKHYPVIDMVYPGPQAGSVAGWSFLRGQNGFATEPQPLADLGFVVVQINGMGTPLRSQSFRDLSFHNMGDNTLADQVAGMRVLAARYSWIDLSRAGIIGHSRGGDAAADAMFRYPDFFKVGVSISGDHDQFGFTDQWDERFMGLPKPRADGSTTYDDQAKRAPVQNLKGKLFLVHGLLDNDVPPNMTLVLADRLVEANKVFDMLLIPNQRHVFFGTAHAYLTRRIWDYFVRNLSNRDPPRDYEIHYPDGLDYPDEIPPEFRFQAGQHP
jgi:dipeptidyl aminopeptidase/acylaminoacyl peptidase